MKEKILSIYFLLLIVSMAQGQRWELYNSYNSDLPEGSVNAVFVDAYGGKWFGTNQGLVHFTGAVWTIYTTEDGLAGNVINDLSGEKGIEEALLFISTPHGVSEARYDDNLITEVSSYNSANSDLHSDTITSIVLDSGLVYYGSPVGLDIRSLESWTFLDTISTIDGDVSLNDIRAMAMTPHGWNYVGTREQGVARLHYDVDGVSGASSYSTDWSGLLSDQINDIYINSDGNQWYATARGVAYHEGYETKRNWETYTELSSGILSNMVHAVAVDGNGTTWAGSDKGISRFDGVSWLSYPYINGITDYAVYDIDFDLDGSIWFASNEGVIHLDELGFPDGVDPDKSKPDFSFRLYPSIASDVVSMEIDVPEYSHVSIYILGMDGRIVHRLTHHHAVFRSHTFLWNLDDQFSYMLEGPHIVLVKTDREYMSRKIFIVR